MLNKEILENLLSTALEGASNYWYLIKDYIPKKGMGTIDSIVYELMHNKRFVLNIYDIEYEDDILGVLSQESVKLSILQWPDMWIPFTKDDFDAEDADNLFQMIVLGEIVYG